MTNKIIHGDSLEVLKAYPENFFHSVVTDPPYGLKFMNKHWDYDVPKVEFWREVLRVLKPGGYVLSFGGTRTYHRMVVNIEDAGFIIRDQLQWIYGSGFPKSLNIGKAVDKLQGNERKVVGEKSINTIKALQKFKEQDGIINKTDFSNINIEITQGSSEWEGYGTALKPANEPICLAMKPLSEKNFAENVLKHGAGGINIDGCRVGTEEKISYGRTKEKAPNPNCYGKYQKRMGDGGNSQGRFPSNVILDEESSKLFPNTSKAWGIPTNSDNSKDKSMFGMGGVNANRYDMGGGSASRFFYCAKASSSERNAGMRWDSEREEVTKQNLTGENNNPSYKNHHATVKPLNLMRYLVRLITPKGGIVLEPFAGSGTTLLAAKKEGFEFVGIERELEYCKIAEQRLESVAINETLF